MFVFPTSTGQPGYETRDQDRVTGVPLRPGRSTTADGTTAHLPGGEDNPLNGNMYKPLYFDRGQAIHGANNVPTSPQSQGCARLRVGTRTCCSPGSASPTPAVLSAAETAST